MWRWRGGAARKSLASAHTAVRLQSQEDKAVWNTREFMWAVWSRREPTTTRTKHDTLPTLYPYPIFSSLRRGPRVRRTSTGAKSRAVGSAGINAGCPSGWVGGKISRASGRGGRRHQVADPQKRETDSASVAGEIFSPAPAAPADRQGLCPFFELCVIMRVMSQTSCR